MKLERFCANWQGGYRPRFLVANLKLFDHPSVQWVMQCKGKEDD